MQRHLLTLIALIACIPYAMAQDDANETPILTIACVSDVHAMNNMLTPASGNLSDITVRSSLTKTLKAMKQQENVDVMILGGDCQSDKTINEANARQLRQVLADLTRGVFADWKQKSVVWVTGNHDYEVANFDTIPKPYNAGDFYEFPMKDDIGELPANELFYEEADNGDLGKQSLLAAFHYQLYGFDFVVLNCGKNFWKSAWDYTYSPESVAWVKQKLDEIYADNPDKTVFFCIHIPFPDSNSLNSGKGMNNDDACKALKAALAEHPNLIMLYGHDHGHDSAYLRRLTSQRITRYDTDGNVIATCDATHVDGPALDPANYVDPTLPDEEGRVAEGDFYVKNMSSKSYLIVDDKNLNVSKTAPIPIHIAPLSATSSLFTAALGKSGYYLHIGNEGLFSRGDASNLMLFRVDADELNNKADTLHCVRAKRIKAGEYYAIVSKKDTTYYVLKATVSGNGTADQRLKSGEVTLTNGYQNLDFKRNNVNVWQLETIPDATNGSFFSSFMGSMRYYYNTFDTGDPADCPVVVQALLVYVYPDRVELKMKNYNRYGLISGIRINRELATYTSYRTIPVPEGIHTPQVVDTYTLNNDTVYDLLGRECNTNSRLPRGIYVKNGHKFVR